MVTVSSPRQRRRTVRPPDAPASGAAGAAGLEVDLRAQLCRCQDRQISLSYWETGVLKALLACRSDMLSTRDLLDICVAPRMRLGPAQVDTLLARLHNRLIALCGESVIDVGCRGIALMRGQVAAGPPVIGRTARGPHR